MLRRASGKNREKRRSALMAELFTNIMQAIIFLGLIFLGVLMKRWIDALKGTVAAQSQTITSQKTLLENLGNVLNAADTPKMLERVQAYKKFVDQEKEAAIRQMETTLTEEKNKSSESSLRLLIGLNE